MSASWALNLLKGATSIWLFDIHELLAPSASTRLEGFDISFEPDPPKESVPSNIILRCMGIFVVKVPVYRRWAGQKHSCVP